MTSQNCLTDKQTRLLMLEAIKYNNIAKVRVAVKEKMNCCETSMVWSPCIIAQNTKKDATCKKSIIVLPLC